VDRLADMETFVRVIESGSFSAAAQQMRLGQPAVSKAISRLEQRLGVRLLLRSTHCLSPTEAGQSYYEEVRAVLQRAEQAELAASTVGKSLSGRLRISAPVTFARLHIVPRLDGSLESASGTGRRGRPLRLATTIKTSSPDPPFPCRDSSDGAGAWFPRETSFACAGTVRG
jgi:DNA-binding transcriptional LysR family regulator